MKPKLQEMTLRLLRNMLWASTASFLCVGMALSGMAVWPQTGIPANAQLVTPSSIPKFGTFISLYKTNEPPLPFLKPMYAEAKLPVYWLGGGRYMVDDTGLDWEAIEAAQKLAQIAAAEAPTGGDLARERSGVATLDCLRGPDELWLEITQVTNDNAYLTLHGTIEGTYYQLLSTTKLNKARWVPGQILRDTEGANQLVFAPVPTEGYPETFFRALSGTNVVAIVPDRRYFPEATEPSSPSTPGQIGKFHIIASNTPSAGLPVRYHISGSASNGLDYATLSGGATISPGLTSTEIVVDPLYRGAPEVDLTEFDVSVVLTLIPTNSYLVAPNHARAMLFILDDLGTNELFSVVSTSVVHPVGMDYHAPSNSLVLSANYPGGQPNNFALLGTNGVLQSWTTVHGLVEEVKLATVKTTANGFTNGELFFAAGQDENGWAVLGRASPDGATVVPNWTTLTNETDALRGGLYVDKTSAWGGDLLVVAGEAFGQWGGRGVWRVNAQGQATLVTRIPTAHLEGVITMPQDSTKWGPLAGRLLTGDEVHRDEDSQLQPLFYAVDTNGAVAVLDIGIHPEDFDFIEPNQDLYCADIYGGPAGGGAVYRLHGSLLEHYAEDLLVTQAGEWSVPSRLFILHWDGAEFVIRGVRHPGLAPAQFEHVTFAPIQVQP